MTWSVTTKSLPPGNLGTGFSLVEMGNMVRRGVQSMRLRPLATRIIARCAGHDFDCEIAALFQFVRDTIRFTKDPVDLEMIGDATVTLETLVGDCDDKMELLAELLGVVGHISRWGIASYDGVLWNHVFVEVSDPYDGRWIALDPTGEDSQVGERPSGAVATSHFDIWPGTSRPSDTAAADSNLGVNFVPNVGMPTSPAGVPALGDCGCGCKGACGCKTGNVGVPTFGPDDGEGYGYGEGYFDAMDAGGLAGGVTPGRIVPLDPTTGAPANPFLPIKNPQSGWPEIMGYPDVGGSIADYPSLLGWTVPNYAGGSFCQFAPGDVRPGSCEYWQTGGDYGSGSGAVPPASGYVYGGASPGVVPFAGGAPVGAGVLQGSGAQPPLATFGGQDIPQVPAVSAAGSAGAGVAIFIIVGLLLLFAR